MGVLFGILGALIAPVTFINGATVSSHSAPQQAVQELRFVEAILGLAVVALGCIFYRLTYPLSAKPQPVDDARIACIPDGRFRVDGLTLGPSGAFMFRETNTGGPVN